MIHQWCKCEGASETRRLGATRLIPALLLAGISTLCNTASPAQYPRWNEPSARAMRIADKCLVAQTRKKIGPGDFTLATYQLSRRPPPLDAPPPDAPPPKSLPPA